jgi:hypothetical protein
VAFVVVQFQLAVNFLLVVIIKREGVIDLGEREGGKLSYDLLDGIPQILIVANNGPDGDPCALHNSLAPTDAFVPADVGVSHLNFHNFDILSERRRSVKL